MHPIYISMQNKATCGRLSLKEIYMQTTHCTYKDDKANKNKSKANSYKGMSLPLKYQRCYEDFFLFV